MFSFLGKSHFQQGKEAVEKADWNKAIKEFSAELEKNPGNADAYAYRARAYLSTQNQTAALADASEAIRLKTSITEAHLVRGIILSNSKNQIEQAIADFSSVLQVNPQSHEAWAYRGNAYNIIQQAQKSLEDLSRAIQLAPNNAMYYGMRAAPRGALGDYMGVVADSDKAIQLGHKTALEYMMRGFAYKELHFIGHAVEDFRMVLSLDPNNAQAAMMRDYIAQIEKGANPQRLKAIKLGDDGLMAARRGDLATAMKLYNETIAMDSSFAIPYNNRATVLSQQGKTEEALKDLNKALELDPNYDDALVNRAVLLSILKRNSEALADCTKALELYPKSSRVLIRVAQVHKNIGEYEKAITYCNRLLAEDPNYAEAYYYRGLCHVLSEKRLEAIADLEKSLSLGGEFGQIREILSQTRMEAPAEVKALNQKGIEFAQKGDYAEALKQFNQVIKECPDYSGGYSNRGNVYRLTNRFDESIRDYSKALELETQNTDALFGRGMAYSDKPAPDYRKAIEDFSQFLKIRPDMAWGYRYRAVAYMKTQQAAEAMQDLIQYANRGGMGYLREKQVIDGWMMVLQMQLRGIKA